MKKGEIGNIGAYNGRYKHGGKGTRLYNIWKGMRKRCFNPNSSRFKWYGKKGISICLAWNDFSVFKKWADNNGYTDILTLDRIDSDKNYCPENCRWVTQQMQVRNKKCLNYITVNEETLILEDWCSKLGITRAKVYHIVTRKKISFDKCIELEIKKKGSIENAPLI